MPRFENIELTVTADVDFEVYCSCGAHLCNETDTRQSRYRGHPQAVVNACQTCIARACEPLEERIAELEAELKETHEMIP